MRRADDCIECIDAPRVSDEPDIRARHLQRHHGVVEGSLHAVRDRYWTVTSIWTLSDLLRTYAYGRSSYLHVVCRVLHLASIGRYHSSPPRTLPLYTRVIQGLCCLVSS